MSVINQVLNQLEQRGAHTAAEQTMVRAVPLRRDTPRLRIVLLFLVAGLAIGALAWRWFPANRADVATANSGLSGPVTAMAVTGSGVAAEPAPETLLPASRLSFELSSVPLPSTLRPFGNAQDKPLDKAQDSRAESVAVATPLAPVPATSVGESNKPLPSQGSSSVVHPAAPAVGGTLPMKQISGAQQADAEFRKAAALMQQGRIAEALAGYEAALRIDATHDQARQALVALLLEGKRGADAERVLQERLKSKPEHTGFSMLLARLQVERGAVEQAMVTLERSLPYADTQADYQAFFAALLQRQNRHKEAVTHYQLALQLVPGNGIWQMGYGISLQALQRNGEAKDAYRRALDSQTLNPDLQAFVQQKLKTL